MALEVAQLTMSKGFQTISGNIATAHDLSTDEIDTLMKMLQEKRRASPPAASYGGMEATPSRDPPPPFDDCEKELALLRDPNVTNVVTR